MSKKLWLKIFKDLSRADETSPRGQKVKEILNYTIKLHPIKDRFCSFDERKLNLRYLTGEFSWYLRGDLNDTSIEEYSKFWNKIKNENSPIWHSNYGHYIFKQGQFDYVFDTLMGDKNSRQASIIINKSDVMMSDTKDKICTYSMSFNIRKNRLNMIINMRSNDVIRGFSIDVVMFSLIYEMLYVKLKRIYPDLEIGTYYHNADSFHIYETHYQMMNEILSNNGQNYKKIEIPRLVDTDVEFLIDEWPHLELAIRTGTLKKEHIQKEYSEFIKCLITWISDKANDI